MASTDNERQSDNLGVSHPDIEPLLRQESDQRQRLFFALKKRYPNAYNDYLLMLMARHATHVALKGWTTGASETRNYLITKYQADEGAIRTGLDDCIRARFPKIWFRSTVLLLGYIEREFALPDGALQIPYDQNRHPQTQPSDSAELTVRATKDLNPIYAGATSYAKIEVVLGGVNRSGSYELCSLASLKRFVAIESYKARKMMGTDSLLPLVKKHNNAITWQDLDDFLRGKTRRFPAQRAVGSISLPDFFAAFAATIGEGYTGDELALEHRAHQTALFLQRRVQGTPQPARPDTKPEAAHSKPRR